MSKRVFITGCSRGLGRAMVEVFAASGWQITGCARNAAAIAELQSLLPAPHHFATCDVADDASVRALCMESLALHGPPDLVLNNAAIINPNAPLWEIPVSEFSALIDINIKGTASVMRHLLPAMIQRGAGVVVNFSSGWGRSTSPDVAPYCASKWAIEGLSQAVAQETGGKVAVVALNPGIIDTEMLRSCFGTEAGHYPDAAKWAERAVPFLAGLSARHNGKPLTAP